MNGLIAAFATFIGLFILVPLMLGFARACGLYVIVGERRCHVYMLFGKVLAIIEEPGLHLLPVKMGWRAFIINWLGKGIDRVILGTAAVRNPALVGEAARDFPGCIAVGIDARDGKVAIEGWAETSEVTALDLARRFEDAGVAAIIHTDIARDGVLQGLNLDATAEIARAVTIPVIASGGLAGIDDVKRLLDPRYEMLEGAIAGRALYDGRLDPHEALAVLKHRRDAQKKNRE